MRVWHEYIEHSRNEPFDDAWTCLVDSIITHHGFYFALLCSCWTRAMQNHNAKVGLSSHKSILQRLRFPMILSFLQSITAVNYCSSSTPSQTTDQADAGRGSPSSWALCLFCPSGSLQSSGDVDACTYFKQLCKNLIEYWFCLLLVAHCHVIPNPFDFLSFFGENYLTVFTRFCQTLNNGKIIYNISLFGIHWRKSRRFGTTDSPCSNFQNYFLLIGHDIYHIICDNKYTIVTYGKKMQIAYICDLSNFDNF